jgi:hypothetical protein
MWFFLLFPELNKKLEFIANGEDKKWGYGWRKIPYVSNSKSKIVCKITLAELVTSRVFSELWEIYIIINFNTIKLVEIYINK